MRTTSLKRNGQQPQSRRLWSQQLLIRLLSQQPHTESGAISMAMGVVVALVLILSGVAVVQLSSGNLRGVFASSDTRQARGAAEEGTELMIDTWNQPQNRRLLVSGQSPTSWNAGNLRSPCFDARTNTRPGPNNDGLPDQTAISLGDGQWRDVASGAVANANQNGRQFRLVRISYTASNGGSTPNPRALRRTATPGAAATGDALPTGFTSWDELVNLDDPDSLGTAQPGSNRGFVVLEVEGRVVRNGQVVANSRETTEFEVLPKCCGASLGSNNSGGMNYAGTTGSLGSDSRLCNLQYGVVTGFNDGWHWSYFANDQFTQRNPTTGVVERYSPILGVVANTGDLFERRNCRVRPGRGKLASGNCDNTPPPEGSSDATFNSNIRSAGAPDANERICRQPEGSTPTYFSGPDSDIRGTSVSCSTIVPLQATAFPDINTFIFNWTAGWGPRLIINQAAATTSKLANVAIWPKLSTDDNDGTRPDSNATIRLRTNNETGRERVEVCLVDQTAAAADNCTTDTWLDVTSRGAPNLTASFGDNFATSNGNNGSNFFNTNWTLASATISDGRLQLTGSSASAFRQANTSGLSVPYAAFDARMTSTWNSNTDYFEVQASLGPSGSWFPVQRIYRAALTTSYKRINLALPFTSNNFQIRFQGGSLGSSERVDIDNLLIESGRPSIATEPATPRVDTAFRGAWCQHTTSAPVTARPGFQCIGPTIDQYDGGTIFVDTTGGPLSLLYNEPTGTDQRFGTPSPTTNPENFIFLSQSPAQFTHVFCPSIQSQCANVIDDENYDFAPVGEPDRLNFFGRNTGSVGQEQNISITTPFGQNAKVGGVWFYLPQGFVGLNVTNSGGGSAASIPAGFYTNNEDNWSFFGRIWVKNFRPYGAFHLRLPDSRVEGAGAALGIGNPAQFSSQSGIDWVARATTSNRLW